MAMRVLVTGATGRVGTFLTRELITMGCEVAVLKLPADRGENLPHGVEIFEGNVEHLEEVETAVRDVDVVCHLAALLPSESHEALFNTNFCGTFNVAEALRRRSCRQRLVFASTDATYGTGTRVFSEPVTERLKPQPPNFYGSTKVIGEALLEEYHRLYGLKYVILRYAWVFAGSEVLRLFDLSTWADAVTPELWNSFEMLDAVPLPFGDNGTTYTEHIVDARDAARATALAATIAGLNSEIFNIAAASCFAYCDVSPLVARRLHKPLQRFSLSGYHPYSINTSRARDLLGFKPQHDVSSMLSEAFGSELESTRATRS